MKKWFKIAICFLVLALLVPAVSFDSVYRQKCPSNILQVPESTEETTEPTEETEPTEPSVPEETFPEELVLTARQAFVYDCETGEFVYLMGHPEDRVYPASITKLFTAYVALQYLPPEHIIQADEVLELVSADSSVAGIQQGNVLTVELLVEAMLLPSGNDAAYILAAEAGRVIVEDPDMNVHVAITRFMDEMNRQARLHGLVDTQFSNPDGYHNNDHYSTYAGLARIGVLALENETIAKYVRVPKEEIDMGGEEPLKWKNTNALLDPESEYYCPYATGLKTGYTSAAGSCLLSSFQYQGQRWIIGVFGCPEKDDRFDDTLQLFNETIQ